MGGKVGFAGELGVPWVFMAARESSLGELRLPRPGNRDLPPKIPTTIPGNCVWQCRSPGLIWPWDFDGVCGETLCLQARSLQQKPPHQLPFTQTAFLLDHELRYECQPYYHHLPSSRSKSSSFTTSTRSTRSARNTVSSAIHT
jgi:hypothetical protein